MKQLLILCLLFISSFCYSQLIYSNQVDLVNLTTDQVITNKVETNVFIFSDSHITVKFATGDIGNYIVLNKEYSNNVMTYKTIDNNSKLVWFLLGENSIGIMNQEYIVTNYLLVFKKL